MLATCLKQHALSGVLLDTNLLLMFLIGSYDPSFISNFKRTAMYTEQDFFGLKEYITKFSRIIITPQVLAETWNFVEKIHNEKFIHFLEANIDQLFILDEQFIEKNSILENSSFQYVGVTDMSVILAAKNTGCLIITDDLRAYSHFMKNNVMAININHFRKL